MMSILNNLAMEITVVAIASLVIWIWRKLWKNLAKPVERVGPAETSAGPAAPGAEGGPALPEGLSILEKVGFLERQREEAIRAAVAARSRAVDDREAEQRRAGLEACLSNMSFLAEGDMLEDRFRLLVRLGGGRASVVWKAYDQRLDRFVALKVLRHPYNRDESVVEQFRASARLMADLSTSSIAAVRQDVHDLPGSGTLKLAYYVLEYVEGVPLDEYVRRSPEKKSEVLVALLEVGRCIARMHAKGLLHRDIKPSNLLVQADGSMKLVDFDAVIQLGDRNVSKRDAGTFGYSAPEVLDRLPDLDGRADVFSLARVFSQVYYGDRLPSPYQMSTADQVDLLNCHPIVKQTLGKASSLPRQDRYGTMNEFLEALAGALEKSKEHLPFFGTIHQERVKIYRILRDSFYATFLVMFLARPILSGWQLVHLSDNPWVAGFHAVIGSLVWGTFISGAFLIYLIAFRKKGLPGYLVAMICCGIGGFLGGVLCSFPSVLVTNPLTLRCLGWLTDLVDGWGRLEIALLQTRMMLAYPLTGLLTGCGLGLCLNRGIEIALRANPQQTGVLPIPTKQRSKSRSEAIQALKPLMLSWKTHVCLAFPIVFSVLVHYVLNAAQPSADLACPISPNALLRCIGEGAVHYAGATGLATGFFYGIRTLGASPSS